MRSDAIFLEQRLLGEVELQRIIRAQTDVEPRLEEVRQRVALVGEEEGVVAERAHRNSDLLEVEKVLKRRDLAQQNSVRDRLRGEERGGQMVGVASLA